MIYPSLDNLLTAYNIRKYRSKCWEFVGEVKLNQPVRVRIKTAKTGRVWHYFQTTTTDADGDHVNYEKYSP